MTHPVQDERSATASFADAFVRRSEGGPHATNSSGDAPQRQQQRKARPSRRCSLATTVPSASMTSSASVTTPARAPRRSSLLVGGTGSPPSPRSRRRASVTFSTSLVETKIVPPRSASPQERDEMFYGDADYARFRWDRMRERSEEMARERMETMERWRENFGSRSYNGGMDAGPNKALTQQMSQMSVGGGVGRCEEVEATSTAPVANGLYDSSAPTITFRRGSNGNGNSYGAPAAPSAFPSAHSSYAPRRFGIGAAPGPNGPRSRSRSPSAAQSYRFDSSRGFAVPLDSVRSAYTSTSSSSSDDSNGVGGGMGRGGRGGGINDDCGIVGENLVSVSLPTPIRPSGGFAGMA